MQGDIDLELEKLRTELRHPLGMFKFAPNELHSASQQVSFFFYYKKNSK